MCIQREKNESRYNALSLSMPISKSSAKPSNTSIRRRSCTIVVYFLERTESVADTARLYSMQPFHTAERLSGRRKSSNRRSRKAFPLPFLHRSRLESSQMSLMDAESRLIAIFVSVSDSPAIRHVQAHCRLLVVACAPPLNVQPT